MPMDNRLVIILGSALTGAEAVNAAAVLRVTAATKRLTLYGAS